MTGKNKKQNEMKILYWEPTEEWLEMWSLTSNNLHTEIFEELNLFCVGIHLNISENDDIRS